ncbi:hypothetical protein LARV_00210 [Longilinea arvoryzae]|uniref:Uncharacterized protein n=1 Tax=Longilinea arvoryzae TaxID=360412 RepID=A0A0S7BFA6_9CHLR|nr:hypothetical protein [Longilinea arvoryzae]GAP12475.1 hypothetical protein LARV_00210 [Longilinea arvoryzae]
MRPTWPSPVFPTPQHQRAAEKAARFFSGRESIDTVLVTNSIARGAAVPDSDLDMNVLLRTGATQGQADAMQLEWNAFLAEDPLLRAFEAGGPFRQVHLDVTIGQFIPSEWDDGGGPDAFEIGIGNLLRAAPLGQRGGHFLQFRQLWLPYYMEEMRIRRLQMVRGACRYDLSFVPFYSARDLVFQAFDRLYRAFQEFLQGLFIARRVYPIAYNKWIREQVSGWLGLPELYDRLPGILALPALEPALLDEHARRLEALLEEWVVD